MTRRTGTGRSSRQGEFRSTERRYRGDTLVLETTLETDTGAVRLVDFMPPRDTNPDLVRIVEGVRGRVEMSMELALRFDYGSIVPWVRRVDGTLVAIAGPDAVLFRTPVEHEGRNLRTHAQFAVEAGDRVPFVLRWFPSHDTVPEPIEPERALDETVAFWEEWAARCSYEGRWHDPVHRSLLTLKALTFAPTGGIVAAPTTSLPEWIGGVRNWDYRYCWLRDATLTLLAFIRAGYIEEAGAWRDWLLRAIAGAPEDLQIMYGVAGERRLTELELPWLSGYEASQPVRIGNGASNQLQLDVYGEVVDALYQATPPRSRAPDCRLASHPEGLRLARVGLARAGRGDLGGARAAPPLHALEGHGVGRIRPRHQDRASASAAKGRSTAGRRRGERSARRSCARATTPTAGRSSSTSARTGSTRASS